MKSNDNFQVETITGGKANAALIIIPGARSALLMLVFSPSDQVLLFSYFLHQISAIVGFQVLVVLCIFASSDQVLLIVGFYHLTRCSCCKSFIPFKSLGVASMYLQISRNEKGGLFEKNFHCDLPPPKPYLFICFPKPSLI